MGLQILFLIKSQFVLMSRKMVLFIRVLWVSIFTSLFTLLNIIGRPFFRLREKFVCPKRRIVIEEESEEESEESEESLLRFRFPTFEEFVRNHDVQFVSNRAFCENSDDECDVVEEKREILSCEIGMIAKPVEGIVEPVICFDNVSDMIAKPVGDIVEPVICSDDVSDMIAKPVEEISEHHLNSESIISWMIEIITSDMIAKSVEEIAERHMNSDCISDVIAKPVENASPVKDVNANFVYKVCDVGKVAENGQNDVSERNVNGVRVEGGVEESLEEMEVENGEETSPLVKSSKDSIHVRRCRSNFLSDDEPLVSDSDSDSMDSSRRFSFRSSFMDSPSDGVLSDIDFKTAFEFDFLVEYGCKDVKLDSEALTEEDIELRNLSKGYGCDDDFEDEDEDILQEYKNLVSDIHNDTDSFDLEDETNVENESLNAPISEMQDLQANLVDVIDSSNMESELLDELQDLESNLVDVIDSSNMESKLLDEQNAEQQDLESNLVDVSDSSSMESELLGEQNAEQQDLESNSVDVNDSMNAEDDSKMESEVEAKQNSEKSSSGEQLSLDSDEQNGLEREWEHQDLVEQLKMEIRKVRATGLPTILEESESPKIMDDLKPWKKIEEKYHQHEGTMDELHKFYKSYRERMRKLDILNYQKMYAIGFLKLKDPLQSFSRNKISTPALAAILSVDCWPCKPKSTSEVHQPVMKRFTRELASDLETVYVGQMCLSWEFLCWEYGKALELWESDPHGMRRYNDVADKFQTFQVLLTRFLEDEPFQGSPRVQHYAKNRCVLRNLLQVPVVRDDNYRDRRRTEKKVVSSKDAITSVQLLEIIEESIRVLWQFIRSDKDTSNAILVNCRRSSNVVELQSPADASLLAQVQSTFQKKDRKFRELTRSENCVFRNFKRNHEDSDNVLYFFSRVDLKLVSRVLNMSKLRTEQLVWCSDKLNKINFIGRKLHVEPSILLFPCS